MVSAVKANSSMQEAPGIVEGAVRWINEKIVLLVRRFFSSIGKPLPIPEERKDLSLERKIMEKLRLGIVHPGAVSWQFERYVPEAERKSVFERIGRKQLLGIQDRLLNLLLRSKEGVALRFQEIGKSSARRDPYQLAPDLERVLTNLTKAR